MSGERWIWMELIGFDNTKAGCGAVEYLDHLGFVPEGISLLLSASDFVFLHENKEHVLFPDICSRQGHEYNEVRDRQVWSSSQLQTLIASLQSRGVKVFFTISMICLFNEFHDEWCMTQFGARASQLTRMPDGGFVADRFAVKLEEVLKYYNFDGYHISDGVIPDGNITDEGVAIYNDNLRFFAESTGEKIPEEWFDEKYNSSIEGRRIRGRFIWENFNKVWHKFMSALWQGIFETVANAVHEAGKLLMMNTVAAKGIFETLFFSGFDMRCIGGKVDILVVESVATSMSLISGNYDKVFDFSAITMEMRAAFPEMKIINLTGCKDVVESFDSIRNAPVLLERDVFVMGNTYSGGKRCSDGVMFCLGDGITPEGWKFLTTLHEQTYSFPATQADGWKLFLNKELYDRMQEDYLTKGCAPSYIYAAELMKRGVELFNVTVDPAEEGALFVPNFKYLPEDIQQRILKRTAPALILNENDTEIRIQLLNIPGVESFSIGLSDEKFDSFDRFDLFNDRIPLRKIPEGFFEKVAELMRSVPQMVNPLNNHRENFFISVCSGSARRCGICSKVDRYTVADCTFAGTMEAKLSKVSSFPVHNIELREGKPVCRKARSTGAYYGALRIPPKGIFIFDLISN